MKKWAVSNAKNKAFEIAPFPCKDYKKDIIGNFAYEFGVLHKSKVFLPSLPLTRAVNSP